MTKDRRERGEEEEKRRGGEEGKSTRDLTKFKSIVINLLSDHHVLIHFYRKLVYSLF